MDYLMDPVTVAVDEGTFAILNILVVVATTWSKQWIASSVASSSPSHMRATLIEEKPTEF